MILLVFDTEVFRGNYFGDSESRQVLQQLGEANELKIVVPHFVKLEYISHKKNLFQKELNRLSSSARTIRIKCPVAEDTKRELDRHVTNATELLEQGLDEIEERFDEWLSSPHVDEVELSEEHHRDVLTKYLEQRGFFRRHDSRKDSRTDFPDAFVCEAVDDLRGTINQDDTLIFISGDKALRKFVQRELEVDCVATVRGFVRSELCQDLLEEVEETRRLIRARLKGIGSFARDNIRVLFSNRGTIDLFEEVATLLRRGSFAEGNTPGDNFEVDFVNDLLNIEADGPFLLSHDKVAVDFTLECDADISYWLLNHELLERTQSRHGYPEDGFFGVRAIDRNFVQVDETGELEVLGTVILEAKQRIEEVDADFDPARFEEYCDLRLDSDNLFVDVL